MKVKVVFSGEHNTIAPRTLAGWSFICPGCGDDHTVYTDSRFSNAVWGYNHNPNSPTFTPSLLVRTGKYADPNWNPDKELAGDAYNYQCHSFITDGRIQFLGDCSHKLVGQTVELPEILIQH